jgi:hypothetical protein
MGLDMTNKGRRVELISTDDPYTSLKSGDKGTYYGKSTVQMDKYDTMVQHHIEWDNGSNLSLIQEFGPNAKVCDQFKFLD